MLKSHFSFSILFTFVIQTLLETEDKLCRSSEMFLGLFCSESGLLAFVLELVLLLINNLQTKIQVLVLMTNE